MAKYRGASSETLPRRSICEPMRLRAHAAALEARRHGGQCRPQAA
jgi:hypothetical protein